MHIGMGLNPHPNWRGLPDTLYPEEVQGFRKLPGTGEKRRSASLADWAERLGRMIKIQGEGTIPS